MNAQTRITFAIVDRFTGAKRQTAVEDEAVKARQDGDLIWVHEISQILLFTGQEVTVIVTTKQDPKRR
jgi:hypothetical protein